MIYPDTNLELLPGIISLFLLLTKPNLRDWTEETHKGSWASTPERKLQMPSTSNIEFDNKETQRGFFANRDKIPNPPRHSTCLECIPMLCWFTTELGIPKYLLLILSFLVPNCAMYDRAEVLSIFRCSLVYFSLKFYIVFVFIVIPENSISWTVLNTNFWKFYVTNPCNIKSQYPWRPALPPSTFLILTYPDKLSDWYSTFSIMLLGFSLTW